MGGPFCGKARFFCALFCAYEQIDSSRRAKTYRLSLFNLEHSFPISIRMELGLEIKVDKLLRLAILAVKILIGLVTIYLLTALFWSPPDRYTFMPNARKVSSVTYSPDTVNNCRVYVVIQSTAKSVPVSLNEGLYVGDTPVRIHAPCGRSLLLVFGRPESGLAYQMIRPSDKQTVINAIPPTEISSWENTQFAFYQIYYRAIRLRETVLGLIPKVEFSLPDRSHDEIEVPATNQSTGS